MLGWVSIKKLSFFGVTLNLHRGKTVKFLKHFFKSMGEISQTKKPELSITPVS
jgi:hypothetical protein